MGETNNWEYVVTTWTVVDLKTMLVNYYRNIDRNSLGKTVHSHLDCFECISTKAVEENGVPVRPVTEIICLESILLFDQDCLKETDQNMLYSACGKEKKLVNGWLKT